MIKWESTLFPKAIGITSSEQLNNIFGAKESLLVENLFSWLMSALRVTDGLFQFKMCAGRTLIWPGGSKLVSVATPLKTLMMWWSNFLWYIRTKWLGSSITSIRECRISYCLPSMKSSPQKQLVSVFCSFWHSCSKRYLLTLKRTLIVCLKPIGRTLDVLRFFWHCSNFLPFIFHRSSKITGNRQNTLARSRRLLQSNYWTFDLQKKHLQNQLLNSELFSVFMSALKPDSLDCFSSMDSSWLLCTHDGSVQYVCTLSMLYPWGIFDWIVHIDGTANLLCLSYCAEHFVDYRFINCLFDVFLYSYKTDSFFCYSTTDFSICYVDNCYLHNFHFGCSARNEPLEGSSDSNFSFLCRKT